MLKMSFYDGTLDREELVKVIEETDKPIVYTVGLSYRHPTTWRDPISKERAVQIAKTEGWLDATEEDDCIHLNAFDENDMW